MVLGGEVGADRTRAMRGGLVDVLAEDLEEIRAQLLWESGAEL